MKKRKKLLPLALALALVLPATAATSVPVLAPATAKAHEIQTHHGCNYWGVNCDGTLTDNEALWFTMGFIATWHPSTKTEPSYHWVTSRPSSSSRWVAHAWGSGLYQRHKCLIDVDQEFGSYTVYATCHFPDW